MTPYSLCFFLLFLFAALEAVNAERRIKNINLFLTFLIYVFLIGFRWRTGTDWESYIKVFQEANNVDSLLATSSMELGYIWSNILVRFFSDSYSLYLVIHAVIFYGLVILFFNKVTKFPQAALLVFFGFFMGIVGSNRQLLAICIISSVMPFIVNKKKTVFILGLVTAYFFHSTVIICSLLLFINKKIKSLYLYILILVSSFVGFTNISFILFERIGLTGLVDLNKIQVYTEDAENIEVSLSLSGLIKRLLFVIIFIYLRDKIEKSNKFYNLFLNAYVISVSIYFIFGKTIPIIMNRGSLYFNILEPILIVMPLYLLKEKEFKLVYVCVMLVLSILLFFQSISGYPDLFLPYKGIFYNVDFDRYMY